MKFLKPALILLSALLLTTGCDGIRSMFGKPTSKDLEKLRVEQEARMKSLRDSIEREEAARVAAAEKEESATTINRFNVVVGSYLKSYNVEAMTKRMQKLGETPFQIPFKSGFTAVAVLSTDDFAAAKKKVAEIIATGAVPQDTWIYDTKTGAHK